MHPRIEIITEISGIKVGEPVTEDQLTALVQHILHDVLHYVHHVDSDKYNLQTAVARIDYLVKTSYGIK